MRRPIPLLLVALSIGLLVASPVSLAQSPVTYDFDTTGGPGVYSPLPVTYSVNGLVATFTSPAGDGSNWSVQNYGTTFFPLQKPIEGNYLWPSNVYRHHMLVTFDHPLTDVSFDFATCELQDQTEICNPIQLTARTGASTIGTKTAVGSWVGAYPQGTLAYSAPAGQTFDTLDIYVPWTATGATMFILDNLTATPAVPEPACVAAVALLATPLLARTRRRTAR